MVATRRGAVIQAPVEPEAAGTHQATAEQSTSGPQSQTSGIKAESSHFVNQSEPFNLNSRRTTRNSSKIEVLSDGNVSEAESTCSTLSGIQTPIISRTTRSRKNASSSQADSVQKNRNKKSVLTSMTISESQDADVSEAESNCSSVSRVRRTVSRCTRSRPTISKCPKTLATQCHPEEVSDSESCSSTVSAGQLNRVTRSRISKLQTGAVLQSQDSSKESILQCLTKNKADDVSDAESWCSGISAARTVGRLTRNSLARSQIGTESQPMVLSNSGFAEKLASDAEQASVGSSRVSRSLRNRTSNQTINESMSKSKAESQSDDLKHRITTPKVTEKRSTRATALTNQTPVSDQVKAGSPEMLSEALEVEKDKCSIQNELEEVILLQPECKDVKRSPMKQKASPKKGNKTDLEPQQIVEEITIDDDDDDDDCEITEVIAAVVNTTCSASIVGASSSPSKHNTGHINEHGSALFLTSDPEIEVSDTMSEDEVVCMEDNNEKVPSEESVPSANDLFIIDKAPGLSSSKQYYIEKQKTSAVESEGVELEEVESIHDETDDDGFIDEDENDALLRRPKVGLTLSTTIDTGLNIKDLGGLYIDLEPDQQIRKPITLKAKEKKNNEEVLKHSIITPDFEKKESVPPYSESVRQLKKKRREERAKTTGDGWFGMRAPELTDTLKNDLKALKMRSAIDPKRFYKKNDRDGFPKYFQVGTVVDSAVDFYHSRIPKKQRKRTIVEELLADSEFRRYNKKKYQEIMTEKMALAAGKKNRKKKKFRT